MSASLMTLNICNTTDILAGVFFNKDDTCESRKIHLFARKISYN